MSSYWILFNMMCVAAEQVPPELYKYNHKPLIMCVTALQRLPALLSVAFFPFMCDTTPFVSDLV
jgi:hypothetical protein